MIEIERVRRYEKMNESSLYESIKDHDELNIIYILSRIEYMQAFRNDNLATTGITDTLKCFDLPY